MRLCASKETVMTFGKCYISYYLCKCLFYKKNMHLWQRITIKMSFTVCLSHIIIYVIGTSVASIKPVCRQLFESHIFIVK